jgi:hypothetical protein
VAGRRRSPQEKKELSLKKDTPLDAKTPKGFRKHWPKKKAGPTRANRHAVKQTLHEEPEAESLPARKEIRKWPQRSLGETIASKRERRAGVNEKPRKSEAARARRRARRRARSD